MPGMYKSQQMFRPKSLQAGKRLFACLFRYILPIFVLSDMVVEVTTELIRKNSGRSVRQVNDVEIGIRHLLLLFLLEVSEDM